MMADGQLFPNCNNVESHSLVDHSLKSIQVTVCVLPILTISPLFLLITLRQQLSISS